jgi:hypothetical protein
MKRMAKYFKVVEIDEEEFINATGEELDCCQVSIPASEGVFVGVDEEQEDEISIPLDCFE